MAHPINCSLPNGNSLDYGECSSGAEYITDLDFPEPCQFQTGDDIIDFYAMDKDNFALDVSMLAVIMVVLRVVGLLGLYGRTYRKNK